MAVGMVSSSFPWVGLRRRNGIITVKSLLELGQLSRHGKSSCTCAGGGEERAS